MTTQITITFDTYFHLENLAGAHKRALHQIHLQWGLGPSDVKLETLLWSEADKTAKLTYIMKSDKWIWAPSLMGGETSVKIVSIDKRGISRTFDRYIVKLAGIQQSNLNSVDELAKSAIIERYGDPPPDRKVCYAQLTYDVHYKVATIVIDYIKC